jgi:hypothetical protein
MYDIKPQVLVKLKEIDGVTVTDAYPTDWNSLPQISFYEQDNSDYLKKGPEHLTEIVIQVDVWHNRSTGNIAKQVDEKLTLVGLVRQFARDIPDSTIKHKTMRYRGIVDNRNNKVYQ